MQRPVTRSLALDGIYLEKPNMYSSRSHVSYRQTYEDDLRARYVITQSFAEPPQSPSFLCVCDYHGLVAVGVMALNLQSKSIAIATSSRKKHPYGECVLFEGTGCSKTKPKDPPIFFGGSPILTYTHTQMCWCHCLAADHCSNELGSGLGLLQPVFQQKMQKWLMVFWFRFV